VAIVELTRGYVAVIDDEDAERVGEFFWQAKVLKSGDVYANRIEPDVAGKRHAVTMHRFILGDLAIGLLVDHRDGNGLDNRRRNLRLASTRQNAENRAGYVRRTREAGGFLGIWLDRKSGLWVASIHAGEVLPDGCRRKISLKVWRTPEEAARAYDAAAAHFYGEFAALNFPDERPRPYDPNEHGTSFHTAESRAAVYRATIARVAKRGVEHHFAKLNPDLVREIRASAESSSAIASKLGLDRSTVQRARDGRCWKEVV
jgi:hypothetical protein